MKYYLIIDTISGLVAADKLSEKNFQIDLLIPENSNFNGFNSKKLQFGSRLFELETQKNDNSNLEKAHKIYRELRKEGIDVLLDDVTESISNKFKKHDLLGVPYQIIVGSKSQKDLFEFKEIDKDSEMLDLNKIIKLIKK